MLKQIRDRAGRDANKTSVYELWIALNEAIKMIEEPAPPKLPELFEVPSMANIDRYDEFNIKYRINQIITYLQAWENK